MTMTCNEEPASTAATSRCTACSVTLPPGYFIHSLFTARDSVARVRATRARRASSRRMASVSWR